MRSTIVHIFGTVDAGGAESRLLDELRRRDAGEHHVIIVLSGRPGQLDDAFRRLGADVVLRPVSWARFPSWFVRFLREQHATHVHAHVLLASGFFLALARLAGVPRRISHLHSVGDGRPDTPLRRAYRLGARAALAASATDIVAVSESARDGNLGRAGTLARRTSVLFDRVDGERFTIATRDGTVPTTLIAIGRMGADKNQERMLDLVAELTRRARLSRLVLKLVGRDPDDARQALERHATTLGIAASVEFLGERADVPQLLASSDLLLSTSIREGLPGVVLEAAAAGIPAVVSSIPANEEAAWWLPSVVPVPLEAADEAWCEVIEDTIEARAGRFAPAAVRAWFDHSPFAVSAGDSALDDLWSASGHD